LFRFEGGDLNTTIGCYSCTIKRGYWFV